MRICRFRDVRVPYLCPGLMTNFENSVSVVKCLPKACIHPIPWCQKLAAMSCRLSCTHYMEHLDQFGRIRAGFITVVAESSLPLDNSLGFLSFFVVVIPSYRYWSVLAMVLYEISAISLSSTSYIKSSVKLDKFDTLCLCLPELVSWRTILSRHLVLVCARMCADPWANRLLSVMLWVFFCRICFGWI